MNYLSLILRIVAILGAIVAGALYFLSADRLGNKEEKIVQMQAELQLLLDKNESADLEIAELQENLIAKTKLVEEAEVKLEEDRAKLVVEMQESQRTQKKLIEAQKEITQLEEMTTRLRKELINAENLFAAASQESLIAQLKERIGELATSNAQLRDQMKTLATPSNDEDSSIDPEAETKTTGPYKFGFKKLTPEKVNAIKEETKIASLSIANGIIVLNTDKQLNLVPGETINLVKATEIIAQVEIININGPLAIAYIKPGAKLNGLSKDDIVKILR